MKLARMLAVLVGAAVLAVPAAASAQLPTTNDPRVGLAPGFENPGTASSGMQLLVNRPKPAGFFNPTNPGDFGFLTSDMAFQGDYAFVGGFNGFQIWNVRNPAAPTLRTAVVCPGGQGDLSVYRNLLFMSVEETRGRIDCGSQGVPPGSEAQRFRGVRIFDISDLSNPVQVAGVQTCRGSHTHTLVTDKHDKRNVYIYVQGTSNTVRPATELAGCEDTPPTGANPARWRIEVIKVPVRSPEDAAIVNEPRLFRNAATGAVDGLQNAPQTPLHPCANAPTPCGTGTGVTGGQTWSPVPVTDACHDITVYQEIGLAAGACEGNGLLIDIRDPANPRRIDAVADPNYAYWHGATFSNDGKYVIFTDEWGGGTTARCRTNDDLKWGGDAIYEIVRGKLQFRSYYKLPVAQTLQENCASHIPSLIPVPGRNIMVQAFYQGGASLVDFTDPRKPVEIGYFDRGPVDGTTGTGNPPSGPVPGGFWSTYWYNGEWYGSELARNLDVVALKPTAQLSKNEIAAAREVEVERLNVQRQDKFRHDPSFAVVRSYLDQLVRAGKIDNRTLRKVDDAIEDAEYYAKRGKWNSAENALNKAERELGHSSRYDDLRNALDDLADEFDDRRHRHGGHD